MNVINSLLLAGESTASSSLLSSPLGMTIILVGFIAFFYFFVIRPQSKRKKDAERMLSSIKKGDKVVSIGGIHGKVVSIKETEIVVTEQEAEKCFAGTFRLEDWLDGGKDGYGDQFNGQAVVVLTKAVEMLLEQQKTTAPIPLSPRKSWVVNPDFLAELNEMIKDRKLCAPLMWTQIQEVILALHKTN